MERDLRTFAPNFRKLQNSQPAVAADWVRHSSGRSSTASSSVSPAPPLIEWSSFSVPWHNFSVLVRAPPADVRKKVLSAPHHIGTRASVVQVWPGFWRCRCSKRATTLPRRPRSFVCKVDLYTVLASDPSAPEAKSQEVVCVAMRITPHVSRRSCFMADIEPLPCRSRSAKRGSQEMAACDHLVRVFHISHLDHSDPSMVAFPAVEMQLSQSVDKEIVYQRETWSHWL